MDARAQDFIQATTPTLVVCSIELPNQTQFPPKISDGTICLTVVISEHLSMLERRLNICQLIKNQYSHQILF
jgi:hypothetical protein